MPVSGYFRVHFLCLFIGLRPFEKGKIMKTMNGIFASAKIFSDNVEEYAIAQIGMICDNEVSKDSLVRVMPDVHPGKVGTIGLTMTIGERVLPNLVGDDIGCGITLAQIKKGRPEFQKMDKVIWENVPYGFSIRKEPHLKSRMFDFDQLRCFRHVNREKGQCSLGTLGSGNHFIELDKSREGILYLTIHSGSRHLGKEVTEYYLQAGQKQLKEKGEKVPYELTYLTGALMNDYLHDQRIVQEFAELNREIILSELVKGMKWKIEDCISCSHNYIEIGPEGNMLRKGAISAKKDEPVIIPINMKEGIILGRGHGNVDWNCSAPHGSGRILKRGDVKDNYTVSNFKAEMKGVYSSCIGKETLDEAPFAYRNRKEIEDAIKETVKIEKILEPVYNYKAGNTNS